MQEKRLISYDTTALERTQRVLLNRSLHGAVSKSVYKGREYRTETKGLLAEPGFEKIGKAVVLAEPGQAEKLVALLEKFQVAYKQRVVYDEA